MLAGSQTPAVCANTVGADAAPVHIVSRSIKRLKIVSRTPTMAGVCYCEDVSGSNT
jgi:hypothetical protein